MEAILRKGDRGGGTVASMNIHMRVGEKGAVRVVTDPPQYFSNVVGALAFQRHATLLIRVAAGVHSIGLFEIRVLINNLRDNTVATRKVY